MKEDSSAFDDILNEADEVEETPAVEAAVEAPAVEEAVEEVVQPEIPEGYKQDERGRWHRPDGTIATKEETAKFGAATSAASPSQVVEGVAAPVKEAVPEPLIPFSFKSQGQEIPLEGATLDKDGNLVVSKSSLANLLPMLARATEFPTVQSREARANQERDTFKKESRELSAKAERATFAYDYIAAILDNEDKLAAFLTDPREREFALRELKLGMERTDIARATADRTSESQAQTAEQTAEQETSHIASKIEELAKSPELAAFLTPEDVEDAKAYFREMRPALVKTATDDSLVQFGVQKGEKYVTHQPMIQYLTRVVSERKKAKEAVEAATKAQKFNVAQTPRTVPPKRPALATAAATPAKKKSWDQSVKDAFTDTDDDE